MSLDVYLTMKGAPTPAGSGIFVRQNGATVEISREEWEQYFPGREPVVASVPHEDDGEEVYWANITHNLSKMASEAGIYEHCWSPEEIGVTHARQLIEPLRSAIAEMRADPPRFEKHNASNGWGLYVHFLPWLERYLTACEKYPDAEVRVSR